MSSLAPELSGKRLELLKEIVPKLSRVAVFGTSTYPGNPQALKESELAAEAFVVKLQYLDVLSPKDIETAFRAVDKGRGDLLVEQPKKFEFIINLKTAKQIGLTLSPEFLARANKVIK